jgi:hypothetical protein
MPTYSESLEEQNPFQYSRKYSIDTTNEYDENGVNIYDDSGFSTSVSQRSGTIGIASTTITGISTVGISVGQYVKTIANIIEVGTKITLVQEETVVLNQETLNTSSITTSFDFGAYPQYSTPDFLENLQADNFISKENIFVRGPIWGYATTDTSLEYKGELGDILFTDGTKVFWGDAAGLGTPLQTIGLWNENLFQGIVANLNFVDGNDPNNLVNATLSGINTKFGDIVVSDRWSVVSLGVTDSDVYRNSRVGIKISEPEYDLDVFGELRVSLQSRFESPATSTDFDNGAVVIVGGLGVGRQSNFGGNVNIEGVLSVFNSVAIDGLLEVYDDTLIDANLEVSYSSIFGQDVEVGGDVIINSTTESSDSITGALIVAGGVGIGGNVYIDENVEILGALDVYSNSTIDGNLEIFGNTPSNGVDSGALVITDGGLGVKSDTNIGGYLNVGGATSIVGTLKVGTSGTVITTTGIGSVGFGTSTPKRDIEFNNKDVFFNNGAIYDSNENVGFRSEQYQVPRNVLTAVGVDTSGTIIPGRFFDAANLIRLNLDFIANETIGFLTSTDYKNPPFVIVNSSGIATDPVNCKDDIKDILKAITYDITRGGNSQSVGAGLSYYNGNTLLHINTTSNGYSVKEATIVAITTASQLARYVINNVSPPKSYQGVGSSVFQIKDLTLQDDYAVGSNTDLNGCANVASAIAVCAGIVTTIIGNGPSAAPNRTYPDGKIVWAPAGADSKNIIYVTKYGNDDNNGRTEGAAKLTIGAAAAVAQPGDTIMVRSGLYIEKNPIGLRTDVTVSGQDLRLVTICPQYDDDVFYVRRGCLIENLNFAFSRNPFDLDIPISISGAAVAFPPPIGIGGARSGYVEPGPATEGPTGRWRSPYIRNCTNFMTGSTGMKINGDHATASSIGNDLKCMVCDSFTQYNENGIGVSITNNGYAQLVSIFTINSNIGIYCDSGGSCDLTNSNSSFGNYGLYAVGLGRTEFTGKVLSPVVAGSDTVVFTGVKDSQLRIRRPFDGQALFFEVDLANYPDANTSGLSTSILQNPMVLISEIRVKNGGSGFTQTAPPSLVILDADLDQNPRGPQGIIAELSPNVSDGGSIASVDIINSGRNYLPTQQLKVYVDGQDASSLSSNSYGLELEIVTSSIYYNVDVATSPTETTGITTVTFAEFIPYELFGDENVSFKRISRILTSSHSFEYIGTGTSINTATPFTGAVPIKANEIVALDGAQIPFTSTDQKGNFDIGEGFQINQPTATIRGRDFTKSIQAEVTPLILALR